VRFVPGLEGVAQTILQDIKAYRDRMESSSRLASYSKRIEAVRDSLTPSMGVIALMAVHAYFKEMADTLAQMAVPSCLKDERTRIRDYANKLSAEALTLAVADAQRSNEEAGGIRLTYQQTDYEESLEAEEVEC